MRPDEHWRVRDEPVGPILPPSAWRGQTYTRADLRGMCMRHGIGWGRGLPEAIAEPVGDGNRPVDKPHHETVRDDLPAWDGGAWVWTWRQVSLDSPEYRETHRAARISELAATRYRHEVGGMVSAAGLYIETTRAAHAAIDTAARRAAGRSVIHWKAYGAMLALTPMELDGLATEVSAHVQACFDNESALLAQLDVAATLGDIDAVDLAAGWPPGLDV